MRTMHIALFYHSPRSNWNHSSEMTRHLRALLHNRDLAQEMAAYGRQTMVQRHTYAHRVDESLDIWAELKTSAQASKQTCSDALTAER